MWSFSPSLSSLTHTHSLSLAYLIIKLCIHKYFPDQWLPFVLCENQQYRSIPDERLARKCATETNISYDLNEFQDCLIGQEGVQLLQDSISVTQSAGATKSCTIHVNGKPRCIRDGGQFYNCPGGSSPSDFVATVCEAYNQLFAVGAASGATKTAPDACGLESSSPRRSGESDTFEGFLNLLVFQK